jgi:exopolyphosphatase/guanosine-5'-triphosphate,3'-diphosphate pyrophosphatase
VCYVVDMTRRTHRLGERLGTDHTLAVGDVIGGIDVGSNAARLKLVRLLDDGAFDIVHQERAPVRPGEGIWDTGAMPEPVIERLVGALERFAGLCRVHRAVHVRAVATSAVREAKNRDDVVARVRERCDLDLEVISGLEEARLIGLGVFRGLPPKARSLLIDIGGGSTEVARGEGEDPHELWSMPVGAVRLTEIFGTANRVSREQLVAMRRYAQRIVADALPSPIKQAPKHAIGSSGTVRAVCAFAAPPGSSHATREHLTRAVEALVGMSIAARRKRFDVQRAEVVIAGAVILESVAFHLQLESVTAVDGGLKEGLLVDLVRRASERRTDPLLSEAVVEAGRRFDFDEAHGIHTRDTALALFDQLGDVHRLPTESRLILEVAAVLHDAGYLVSSNRHHKHSMYLIQNMDLPGISDRERALAALVARFHRRSPPTKDHPDLVGLDPTERRVVRGLTTLLRIADATDQSHEAAVEGVSVSDDGTATIITLHTVSGRTIEPFEHEGLRTLFRSCFGRRLQIVIGSPGRRKRSP